MKAEDVSHETKELPQVGSKGVIGPKEGDRIWDRHIANCLPVTTLIPQGVRVVDIGSGAGLP